MPADNSLADMKQYERQRSHRYEKHPVNACYSNLQLIAAYKRWAHCPDVDRTEEWDLYCDVRDGKPMGTNLVIRESDKKPGRRPL